MMCKSSIELRCRSSHPLSCREVNVEDGSNCRIIVYWHAHCLVRLVSAPSTHEPSRGRGVQVLLFAMSPCRGCMAATRCHPVSTPLLLFATRPLLIRHTTVMGPEVTYALCFNPSWRLWSVLCLIYTPTLPTPALGKWIQGTLHASRSDRMF